MPAVQFAGLSTGLPPNLVEQLINAQRQPIVQMENQKSKLNSRKAAVTSLQSKVQALLDSSKKLDNTASFRPKAATSSNDATVRITSTSATASAGSFDITVNSMAKADKFVLGYNKGAGTGTGFDTKDTALVNSGTDGALTFDFEGTSYSYSMVSGSTTLEDLVASINGDTTLNANAGILFDGTDYRLVLSSQNEGLTNATGASLQFANMQMTQVDGTLLGTTGALTLSQATDFNNSTVASDASITVDGITVTSTSNTVSDVIAGTTFELLKDASTVTNAGDEKATINITDDVDQVKSNINQLVDDYNSIMLFIKGQADSKGPLFGHAVSRNVQGSLQSTMTTQIAGLTGKYQLLSSLGLETQRNGLLSVDATKLSDALADDFVGVSRLFIDDATSGTSGVAKKLTDVLDLMVKGGTNPDGSYYKGMFEVQTSNISSQITNLTDRITLFEDRLDRRKTSMDRQFTNLEKITNSFKAQQSALNSMLAGLGFSYG